MKSEFNISPLKEVKLPEEILARFASLFVRICLLIYTLPVLISLYRNFFLDPTPLGIPVALLYTLTAALAWRHTLLPPRTQIGLMILILSLGAVTITIRNESIMSASTTLLFASIALMMLLGLRLTLSLSLAFLTALFALYLSLEPPSLMYGVIHMALAICMQTGILIAINAIWNMFIEGRNRLEHTLRMTEVASRHSRIGLFRRSQSGNHWGVNSVYRSMFGIKDNKPIRGFDHIRQAIHPDDLPDVARALERGLKDGETLELTHRLLGAQGYRWVQLSAQTVEEQGELVTYGSVVDIHEAREERLELDRLRVKSLVANDTFNLGIADGDESSGALTLDNQARKILGLDADGTDRFSFEQLRALVSEDQLSNLENLQQPTRQGNSVNHFIFKLTRANEGNQSISWIRGAVSRYNSSDNQTRILVVLEDITEQELNKQALEVSAEENRELVEQLRLATDEADIRIIEENLTAKTARYITRGKAPRKTPPTYNERLELVPEEYLSQVERAYSEPGAHAEYPIIGRGYVTGVEWLRQLYVRRIRRNGEDYALFMVSSITRQKKAQLQLERSFKQLEQSLARLDEIARAGKIGLFDWSRESDILRPNAIFREQTGLSEELYPIISTRNFFELFSDDEGLACFNQLRAAKPDVEPLEYQLKMQCKSGDVRWVRLIASVQMPKGEGIKVSGSLIDLTEYVELQEQLRNANDALQRQSRTDPLTQLANRRELDDFLYTQQGLRQRDPHSFFSLMMIDIDYFKAYNDLYGHPMGDKALKCVADLMRKVARRPGDLVARFGGEEFVIVLTDTDAEGAKELAHRIEQRLDAEKILHEGSPFKQLTLSIGIASLKPEELCSPADLIESADAALYGAKSLGRNRIELAKYSANQATHPQPTE